MEEEYIKEKMAQLIKSGLPKEMEEITAATLSATFSRGKLEGIKIMQDKINNL